MRWERLFAELEGQGAAQTALERDDEVADLVEGERAQRLLRDSVVAGPIQLAVAGFGNIDGTLIRATATWLLVATQGYDAIVSLEWITRVRASAGRTTAMTQLDQRATWAQAMRALQREHSAVHAVSFDGMAMDGAVSSVAKDFFEIETVQRTRFLLPYRCISVIVDRDGR